MKRQLGLSLVVLAVLAVPHAWSQTGSDPIAERFYGPVAERFY